ncbi:MAG: efflux RND transporter periplasmic adaptor subunit [Bacteroidales bacterium]|nr:efflux RND transporter periplasmic adaptor subunit [Bacteroidales bacterium]
MKRKLIIITSALLTIAIVMFLLFRPEEKAAIGYQSSPVFKGKIVNTVTATGTVEPIIKVEVGTQVSGIIDHIYVDFNSKVKKGTVLALLDRTNLEAELKSSEATLKSAETEYEFQKKNYERSESLYDKNLISDTEYESSKYSYDKANSAFIKATSDIKKVRQNLAYATIYSPIDGVVLDRAVDEGQTVAASFSTPTLFTIANDLTRMQVIANVDEADIGEVMEGQSVSFTVDAFPEDTFNGKVTQVRLQPTTTSNVVTYEVVVNAPNPDYKLKPGLTANITITTQEKENILLVPSKALRFTPASDEANSESVKAPGSAPERPGNGIEKPQAEGQTGTATKTIWIKKPDGSIAPVKISAGISDGIYTEVYGEVKEGDLVVTGMTTAPDKTIAKESDTGKSPFMPTRPGEKKK